MGLLIHYAKAKFWHACKREDVPAVLESFKSQWGQMLSAEYVTRWQGDEVAESEPVKVD